MKILFILFFAAVQQSHGLTQQGTTTTTTTTNSNDNKHSEPMLAVTCPLESSPDLLDPQIQSKPPSYIIQSSNLNQNINQQLNWTPDPLKSPCTHDKLEILKHCQRLYPTKDITNIVESTKNIKINQICKNSNKNKIKCFKNYFNDLVQTVFYRCLESPFQSDALLVPSPCIFDHIHNASTCWDSKNWNQTAYKSCNQREMNLKSYAVLLPCGVGLFTGVEFVCCPKIAKIVEPIENNYDDEYDEDEEDEEDDDYIDPLTSTSTSTTTTTTQKPSTQPPLDIYFKRYDTYNEHSNFKSAESRLENVHRFRMSKVMHDWQELEKKYQEMRTQNLDAEAEEFKRTVTIRFQKTIKALEEEGVAERRQLIAVHQQRVLSHINERKKESMECFTSSLTEQPQNANRVRKCLEKLMRILHKDRHHTLAHYKHLLKSNPKQGQIEEEYTLQRLTQISQTARQALKMMERHPSITSELKPQIEDYVLSLQGRDDPPGSLLTATHETEEILLSKYKHQVEKIFDHITQPTVTMTTTETIELSSSTPTTSSTYQPSTTEETEDNNLNLKNHEINSHSTRKDFTMDQIVTVRREVYHKENKPIYFTMAFAGIAILGAMVIGLIVLKRRANSPRNQGFLEVNMHSSPQQQLTSPEEKHVANMQINGYENPTYKYFESPPAPPTNNLNT